MPDSHTDARVFRICLSCGHGSVLPSARHYKCPKCKLSLDGSEDKRNIHVRIRPPVRRPLVILPEGRPML